MSFIKPSAEIRMLDNDLIRLQQKVNTVIEYRKQQENNEKNTNTKSTRK